MSNVIAATQHRPTAMRESARFAVISLARYRALFGFPELRRTISASVIGRLPIGVTGLAILLTVQTHLDSFAAGGAASGAYVVGLAAVAPLLGRAIDRYGPRKPLLLCAFAFPAALLALVGAVLHHAPTALIYIAAAVSGAFFPPITVCMRTLLRRRLQDESLLVAAYSLESVLIEVIFIAGPLVVALFVALASSIGAVLFSAACAMAGTLLFVRTPPLRGWIVERPSARNFLGPLRHRDFVLLIAIVLAYSTAFGLLEIGITAYASHTASPALAGVLLGIMSVGSAVGGLVYGSRAWHFPLVQQMALALLLMGVGLGLLAVPMSLAMFMLLCAVAGIVMAPALIIQSMLVAKLAPREHSTEAFTWSTSALLSGVGLGLGVGGVLLEAAPAQGALAAGAVTATFAALATRLLLGSRS